ncbi:AraC family transcriptional regulator, partial [Salmonella enterica]|nr:AraC family transcriptional regulator [Salmonella enterica]
MELLRQELAGLVVRHCPSGTVPSAIADLHLSRYEQSTRSMPTLAQPALCILAQGRKEICLGDETYVYDPLHYMVVSVAMPISGALLEASPQNPS